MKRKTELQVACDQIAAFLQKNPHAYGTADFFAEHAGADPELAHLAIARLQKERVVRVLWEKHSTTIYCAGGHFRSIGQSRPQAQSNPAALPSPT